MKASNNCMKESRGLDNILSRDGAEPVKNVARGVLNRTANKPRAGRISAPDPIAIKNWGHNMQKENLGRIIAKDANKQKKNGAFGGLLERLRPLGRDIYNLKIPLATAISMVAGDGITSIGITSATEANPTASTYMQGIGVAPVFILTGLLGLAAYMGLGKAMELISNNKLPKNSLVKAGLYGLTASEALIVLNNYCALSNHVNNAFMQITQQSYGGVPFSSVLYGLSFLPMAGTAAYYYIKSALRAKKEHKIDVTRYAKTNLNETKSKA